METRIEEHNENNEPDSLSTIVDDVDRQEFNRIIGEILKRKRSPNTFLRSRSEYYTLLEQVKMAKSKLYNKTPADYRRAKRFDVIQTPDGERLVIAPQPGQNGPQVLVTMDDMYDIIREYHLKSNHSGRTRMMKLIKANYKNVTAECVSVYLSLCKLCKNQGFLQCKLEIVKAKNASSFSSSSRPKDNDSEEGDSSTENSIIDHNDSESLVSVPIPNNTEKQNNFTTCKKVHPELYSRGQVDILIVTPAKEEEYRYMLVYRDYVTKFIHLRAIKTTGIDETVDNLLEIFLVFGTPNILQSKNDVALIKLICKRISVLRPDIVVLASNCNFSNDDFKGKSNEDILNRMNTWMAENSNTKWDKSLKHVQHSLNTTFHSTLCRTPSEVMFGVNPRKGIASSLPLDICRNLTTDDDLKVALEQKENLKTEHVVSEESLILPNHFIKVEDEIKEEDCFL